MAKLSLIALSLAFLFCLTQANDPFDVDPKFKMGLSCEVCQKAVSMVKEKLGSEKGKIAVTNAVKGVCKVLPKVICPDRLIKSIVGKAIDLFNNHVLKPTLCGQSLLKCQDSPQTFKKGPAHCEVIKTIHRELNSELVVYVSTRLCPKILFGTVTKQCLKKAVDFMDTFVRAMRQVAEEIAGAIDCPRLKFFKAVEARPSRMSGLFDDSAIDDLVRFINELDRTGGK